ncbi:hypothetical protein WJX73_004146 [Symbiochloris irregularis]|uniref:Uncharacterized protein n=1 Tax=Symbiochloris irregularis TaxID=706552 RepID=A0AAW1NN87_9CHLO
MQVDLEVVPEGFQQRAASDAADNILKDEHGPGAKLILSQEDGLLDAQLQLQFSANDEDTQRILCALNNLLPGGAESSHAHTDNKVVQGLEELIRAMGMRARELEDTRDVTETSLDVNTKEITTAATQSRRGLERFESSALPVWEQEGSSSCKAGVLFALGLTSVGSMLVCMVVLAARAWRDHTRKEDAAPLETIVYASEERIPGFLPHEGLQYAYNPLSSK